MIKIINLTKRYNSNIVINNISLEIPDKQKLAIIGPSGCGKSTLLRLLIGLSEPTKGSIYINNVDISRLHEDGLAKVRRKVGMVFQSSALFDSLNVFENVAFGLRQDVRLKESEIKARVNEKLQMVDLEGTQSLMPSQLSGGMQKRVSLARTIAPDPEIILYDEPTTGLDPITSTTIENLINKLTRELHTTSIIVTHQLSTVYRTCDRIIMMNEGTLIESGNVSQTQNTNNPIIRNFIKGGF